MRKTVSFALMILAAGAAGAALMTAFRPASGQEPGAAGSALDTFAATGNRVQVGTFMSALSERNKDKSGRSSSFSLYLPDPFQIMEYGEKAGVHSFVRSLPEKSRLTLLVSDARKLAAIGDKETTLAFMRALSRKGIAVELIVPDVSGLSYVGEKASLITFLGSLPEGSVVKLYTTPGEISNNGADAGLIRFINSVPCRLEVHMDDPLIRNYLVK